MSIVYILHRLIVIFLLMNIIQLMQAADQDPLVSRGIESSG